MAALHVRYMRSRSLGYSVQQDIRCFSRQVRKTYMTPANWFPLSPYGKRRFVDDSFHRVLQQVSRKRMKYVYRKRAVTIRGCQTGRRNFNPPLAALSHKQEICFRQCMAVNYAFFAWDSRLRSSPFLNYEWAERTERIGNGLGRFYQHVLVDEPHQKKTRLSCWWLA